MTHPIFMIHFIARPPKLKDTWDSNGWQNRTYIDICHFRPESSLHRPSTHVKLCYNKSGIFGIFKVKDRFVICRHTRNQEPVYKDSCVEFFIQPKPQKGYFNFEFNCGGALLSSYITDSTRIPGGFKGVSYLTDEECRQVKIHTTLPSVIKEEITDAITWQLSFFIPFELLKNYIGRFRVNAGTFLKANFFKCADESSHPHWAAWSPVDQHNFHLPRCFGKLKLI